MLNLPDEVLATPYGQTLLSFLANFETAAATHDAENSRPDPRPSRETPPHGHMPRHRPSCGPCDVPMFMMMGRPWGGAYGGCPPCRPRRGGCAHVPTEDKPSTSRASPAEQPQQPNDPVAACLGDLVDALRSAGREDLLDNVLAEHHAVLASLRSADDEEMPEAPKKASDDSFEVVQ